MTYIAKIKSNSPDAVKIKMHDLQHNMDTTRIGYPLCPKDIHRIDKYHKAYLYLSEV